MGTIFFSQFFAGRYGPLLDHALAGTVVGGDFRTAERPAGAVVHVNLQAEAVTFGYCMAKHLHPFRRQIVDVVGLVALHTVDRRDFYASKSFLCKFLKVEGQTFAVNGTAEPPPADKGAVFNRRGIPVGRMVVRRGRSGSLCTGP